MSHQRSLTAADYLVLHRIPLFSALSADALLALFSRATVREFDATTHLFSAGDPADAFFAVLSGQVHLFALTPDGTQGVVALIGAAESFAEGAVFGPCRYPLHAEVQPGAALIRIDRATIDSFIHNDAAQGLAMLDALLVRQQFLMQEIVRLRAQSPSQRLASYLLTLTESRLWSGAGRLPMRKQVIASRIGIEPESLSRALRRLQAAGVHCQGDDVMIEDIERLRAFCAATDGPDLGAMPL